MTLGVTLGDPTGVLREPIASTLLVHDEYAEDGGLGGGGSDSFTAARRAEIPELTPAQQFRFGFQVVGKGLDQMGRAGARTYDQWMGRNDPHIEVVFRPGGNRPSPSTPPSGGPSPRGTRHKTKKAPADIGTNWQRILQDLERELARVTKELEAKTDEAKKYRDRAEEYAPAALALDKAKKRIGRLEALLQKKTGEKEALAHEVETLRHENSRANTALEATLAELEKAKATAEENVALIRQVMDQTAQIEALHRLLETAQAEIQAMRDAVAMSDQLIKVAGMEQKLRVRAEKKAADLLQYLDSLEEGIGKHRQSLSLLLDKAVEANRRIESTMTGDEPSKSKEFDELKAELAAKQVIIEDLKSQVLAVEAHKAELAMASQELAITQLGESSTLQQENEQLRAEVATARQEAVKYRAAAEAAEERAQNTNELIEQATRLREEAASARADAAQARDDLAKASQAALRQRKRANRAEAQAKVEKARADEALDQVRTVKARAIRYERLVKDRERVINENIDLRLEVELLQARMKAHAKIAAGVKRFDSSQLSDRSSRTSDSGVSLRPDVSEAFQTLRLPTTATYKEFRAACGARLNLLHPDSVKDRPEPVRAMAAKELQIIIDAGNILSAYFEQKKAAAVKRDCA